MKKIDLAYYAGIFDGEGCIVLHSKKYNLKDGHKRTRHYLEVCLANTNEWLCRQILFSFGGNVYKRKQKTERSQAIWAWQTSSKKALLFLEAIYPYLKLKRPQAEIAMQFENSLYKKGKHMITEKEMAIHEVQKLLISNLNKGRKATSTETQ